MFKPVMYAILERSFGFELSYETNTQRHLKLATVSDVFLLLDLPLDAIGIVYAEDYEVFFSYLHWLGFQKLHFLNCFAWFKNIFSLHYLHT